MKYKFLMVTAFAALVALPAISFAAADHAVRGHIKKDGKYVAPHRATNPNNTKRDNYSSKPNVNPYSGKQGKREPEK